jgi:hypothetical protein
MKLRYIGLIVLLVVSAIVLYALIAPPQTQNEIAEADTTLNIVEAGRAGEYGYAIVTYRGSPKITMLSYNSSPIKKVTILNESESMSDNLPAFVDDLDGLADYGFDLEVSDDRALGSGIYIVPTGAMPSYIVDDLHYNATDSTIIYIGAKDLIIRDGVKKEDWYSSLDQHMKDRLIIHEINPDEFVENEGSLFKEVLENNWSIYSRTNASLSGSGKETLIIPMKESSYLRIISSIGSKKYLVDSIPMPPSSMNVESEPSSIFPWEKSTVSISLNKTNGTAFLDVWKDGSQRNNIVLGRVTEENFFQKRLSFNDSGEYILKVSDNSGTIASGLVHVKDLEVTYIGSIGVTYLFNVSIDGMPMNNAQATVYLSNGSAQKEYFVSDGLLSIPAQLKKGNNTFHIQILGKSESIDVTYTQEDFAEVYLKYGLPGLLVILAVYFGARMSRRPVYTLRVGEAAGEIRQDVRISPKRAVEAFRLIRKDLGLGNSPITAHEFSIALKRQVTDGADVTEGNVEEILQLLVKRGELKSHRQHYQLKGEGDVRQNTLVRMIRDQLIESGIKFKKKGITFIGEHYEIGFFGSSFTKKAIVVVESQDELDSIYSSLNKKELAKLKLKIANGKLRFVKIDRLKDVL